MTEKKSFAKEVKEESLKAVNEFLDNGEELEFFITGYNVDAIYARVSGVGGGFLIGGGAILAGYPTNDWVEYTSLYFTNQGIVVLNCNKFLKMVNRHKIKYEEIITSSLYLKNKILEISTMGENGSRIAIEFEKNVLKEYSNKLNEKLIITELKEKYSSGAKKAYDAAIGASVLTGAAIGAITFEGIFNLKNK